MNNIGILIIIINFIIIITIIIIIMIIRQQSNGIDDEKWSFSKINERWWDEVHCRPRNIPRPDTMCRGDFFVMDKKVRD